MIVCDDLGKHYLAAGVQTSYYVQERKATLHKHVGDTVSSPPYHVVQTTSRVYA